MMADIQYAWKYANQHRASVVVVVTPERYQVALGALVACAGNKYPFGGRSAALATGGRVAVLTVLEPVVERPFNIMFAGWSQNVTAAESEEMIRWRKAADQVIARG